MVFRKMRKHSGPWRQERSGVLNTHDEQRVQRGESGADVVKMELVCSEQNAGPKEEHCSQMLKGLQAEPEGHK